MVSGQVSGPNETDNRRTVWMRSPTALALTRLRRLGFIADTVEKWIPRVNRKRDLFGFGDILAMHARDRCILIVQATTAAHAGDRLRKARSRPELALWLRAGGQFQVWGWVRRKRRWVAKSSACNPSTWCLCPGPAFPPAQGPATRPV
jgi:hypothetical protein